MDVAARRRATLLGFVAVLMWALLALLTAASGRVPPFQLAAMAFAIAFLLALGKWLWRGEAIFGHLRQPPLVWAVGIGGLFGYHFFYFLALRRAPAVEASLIAYLWPLLIVLFSALLPGERLRWWHIAGGLAGLAGAGLLLTGGEAAAWGGAVGAGHLAAMACAVIWSSYSVLSRRFAEVPTDTVGGFCGATAVLAGLAHLLFERTVWPADAGQWLAVAGLGLGPVGLAFFFWDHGVKRGQIQALGAAAYAAPLLSTLLLILFGFAEPTWTVAIACLLITGGAVLAAKDLLVRKAR
ncbi:MAG: DMT family transporter [Alphaproteobacteria bacterium]|jgi:drug/metabolite transporter (DMT)-like permease|nr:DMT family transporter [Alphaproteobacteria bacterium]MDP6564052.1 DMT family transporter [Alphaproteobacteria bacterium]MDP6816282.1 DMT family transporter [Alphaproteobacteria bacterium]